MKRLLKVTLFLTLCHAALSCIQVANEQSEIDSIIKKSQVLVPEAIKSRLIACPDDSLVLFSVNFGNSILKKQNTDSASLYFNIFLEKFCRDLDFYPSCLLFLSLNKQYLMREEMDYELSFSFVKRKQVIFDIIDSIQSEEIRKSYFELGKQIVLNNKVGSDFILNFERINNQEKLLPNRSISFKESLNLDEHIAGQVVKVCHNFDCRDSLSRDNFYVEVYLKILQNSCVNCTYDDNKMILGDTVLFLLEPEGWYLVNYKTLESLKNNNSSE